MIIKSILKWLRPKKYVTRSDQSSEADESMISLQSPLFDDPIDLQFRKAVTQGRIVLKNRNQITRSLKEDILKEISQTNCQAILDDIPNGKVRVRFYR